MRPASVGRLFDRFLAGEKLDELVRAADSPGNVKRRLLREAFGMMAVGTLPTRIETQRLVALFSRELARVEAGKPDTLRDAQQIIGLERGVVAWLWLNYADAHRAVLSTTSVDADQREDVGVLRSEELRAWPGAPRGERARRIVDQYRRGDSLIRMRAEFKLSGPEVVDVLTSALLGVRFSGRSWFALPPEQLNEQLRVGSLFEETGHVDAIARELDLPDWHVAWLLISAPDGRRRALGV